MTSLRRSKIGVVLARTGRLAELSPPVEFVAKLLGPRLRRRPEPIDIALCDSRSTPEGARAATEELALRDDVDLMLSLGGGTLPAVARTCERLEIPCVSTVLPWQVYLNGRAEPNWAFHFCWGLDDVANVFADMWAQVAPECVVGCLWNDGAQGQALREPAHGFLPTATERGHPLVQLPGYAEPAGDFGAQIDEFSANRAEVVTSAAAAEDLAAFLHQAGARGVSPRLVTCSRWPTCPFGIATHNLTGVATIVSWTPFHDHQSSLDGTTPEQLADSYQRVTQRPWSQPLGLAYALFEVAVHALTTGEDPADNHAVASILRKTRLSTMAGFLDWTTGPAPNVATVPLAGGQWQRGNPPELAVVTNCRAPAVPCTGELVL